MRLDAKLLWVKDDMVVAVGLAAADLALSGAMVGVGAAGIPAPDRVGLAVEPEVYFHALPIELHTQHLFFEI